MKAVTIERSLTVALDRLFKIIRTLHSRNRLCCTARLALNPYGSILKYVWGINVCSPLARHHKTTTKKSV